MHPLNYCLGLAKAAAAAGVALHETSPVTQLDLEGSVKRVATDRGEVAAAEVVFCLSGYIGGLYPPLSRATLPVGTYVMVTEPLGDGLAKAIRAPHAVADNRFAQDYYRPLPEGRILWGGRIRALSAPADLKAVMLGDLLKVYPQLSGIRAELAWEGTMGYATHKMPQIGRLKPGVWYCMGFGGHGLCPTTAGGEIVAAAIAEGDDRYRLFAPFGLTYAGGPLGRYVTQLVYWSYEIRDHLKA
jgi:gamma-glutamylputrescine oxidase